MSHATPKTKVYERATTILLVEDEPFVLEATSRILSSAGFEVVPAMDANAAKLAYEQHRGKIDLVMTDMVLPGRSGLQLVEDLRSASSNVSILLTSGYGESGCDPEDLQSGTHYLSKPYSKSELVAKIAKILECSPAQRAAKQGG